MSAQIPSTSGIDPKVRRVLDPLKENMEKIRGQRGSKIDKLTSSASTAEIIAKINEIISRIQD